MKLSPVFINLPVSDIAATRAFWSALGFSFDERFSDDNAVCLIIEEDHSYAMLLKKPFFGSFTTLPVADGAAATEVMTALMVDGRAQVDALCDAALAAGATAVMPPQDMGFMYSRSFRCVDGHHWEVGHMDMAAAMAAMQQAQ